MDKTYIKKIKKYICSYIIFALVFTAFIYIFSNYETMKKQNEIFSLIARYPEMETDIIFCFLKSKDISTLDNEEKERLTEAARVVKEQYGYNIKSNILADALPLWSAGLFSGAILAVLLLFFDFRENKREKYLRNQLNEIYECLVQYRKGNFGIPLKDAFFEGDFDEYMKLWDTVKELGLYFNDLTKRLEREEESTKSLITDISHQLKTPLASLRMSFELVTGEGLTVEERKEFQQQEAKEIEKLELLLGELVKLSRLEVHMIQIKPVLSDLKHTITEAVNRIYMKAKSKNIDIEAEIPENINIKHDVKWTVEAVVNVLDNAVKYSEEYTLIVIRVEKLVQNVMIEIEDEGMGISSGDLVKIYQRFYRGRDARERVEEGVGVGLYLTRMILERQGGTISAKSKFKKGTIFKITLPL